MKQERRAIRAGVVLILLAAVWRLASGSGTQRVADFFQDPDTAAVLVSMETGRLVRLSAQAQTETTAAVEETEPVYTQLQTPVQFASQDAALLSVYDMCGYSVDLEALLLQELDWDLSAGGPAVLIVHTHTTESYTRTGQDYMETAAFRTLDTQYNMVQVGSRLTQQLEEMGIGVIHDSTVHDYPSYTGAYNSSRRTVQDYLKQYPSIRIVLDIHRDAAQNSDGTQMVTAATVDGQSAAQLMMVVGTDAGGLNHPNWQENMALAAKLHVTLEKQWPGVCRPLCFRSERFNQDLLGGALLVEVGSAGNTLEEALAAVDCLAWAIGQLAQGAN